ncbi:hypothetical protein [Eoetvoesiella caeni]
MMTLTTYPQVLSANKANVFWRVGRNRAGVLEIELPKETENVELISELCAIRFLLMRKRVFNVLPNSGNGLELHVSSGAIRKLVQGKSSKQEAVPYALFLSPRLDGISYKVGRESIDSFPIEPAFVPEHVYADPEYFLSPYDALQTPAIGEVNVTAHAVAQYVQRCSAETINQPWKSLVNRLQHPDLKRLPIPEKVLTHKKKKYGVNNDIEAWGHENSQFTYLVAISGEIKSVVTVFRRIKD